MKQTSILGINLMKQELFARGVKIDNQKDRREL